MELSNRISIAISNIKMDKVLSSLLQDVVVALNETMGPYEIIDCFSVTEFGVSILPKIAVTEIMLDKCVDCLDKLNINPTESYNDLRNHLHKNIEKTAVRDPEAAAIIALIYYILYPKNNLRPSSKNKYDARKLSVILPDEIKFKRDHVLVRYFNFEFNKNNDLELVYKVNN